MIKLKIDVLKRWVLPMVISMLVVLTISCGSTDSGDDEVRFEDGLLVEINDLLGDDLLNVLENELEVPIHRGENPPNLETIFLNKTHKSGSFTGGVTILMEPLLLLKSNVPNERSSPGDRFSNSFIRFSNQNMEKYTIDYEDYNTSGSGNHFQGEDFFIVGGQDRFSIFGVSESEQGTGTVVSLDVFSGIITEDGITAPHSAFIMIDNGGVSGFLPNETGRSFEDGDGLAELTTWQGPEKSLSKATTAQKDLPDKWKIVEQD